MGGYVVDMRPVTMQSKQKNKDVMNTEVADIMEVNPKTVQLQETQTTLEKPMSRETYALGGMRDSTFSNQFNNDHEKNAPFSASGRPRMQQTQPVDMSHLALVSGSMPSPNRKITLKKNLKERTINGTRTWTQAYAGVFTPDFDKEVLTPKEIKQRWMRKAKVGRTGMVQKYIQIVQPIKSKPFNPGYRKHIKRLMNNSRMPPKNSVGLGSKDINFSATQESAVIRASYEYGSDQTVTPKIILKNQLDSPQANELTPNSNHIINPVLG